MWDLQSARQRKSDPYFIEIAGVKQPAVISLNGAVASQAITLFLSAVAGVPVMALSIRLRIMRGDTRLMDTEPRPECINCSVERGFFGKGYLYLLPSRTR
jgi:molybdopterin-synthase adenylyltransferase